MFFLIPNESITDNGYSFVSFSQGLYQYDSHLNEVQGITESTDYDLFKERIKAVK
jgi:hypothetical protein